MGILHWSRDGVFLVPRDNNVANIDISESGSSTDGPEPYEFSFLVPGLFLQYC